MIAVPCLRLMMLTGRTNGRYGAVVIVGCFTLFGAVSIVAGIRVNFVCYVETTASLDGGPIKLRLSKS
ncbi:MULTISPECIES: hypothetical protein [Brevundimonas]|uniref:hypothetical protein n=1 Tax=Brevundimonas TaxID=41275 RepID=UPI000E669535|nr:hypothetical protein [Brevundimonas sp. LPMIX5]RIJ67635.1 hypothetical protein D1604_05025 [Brevundimonas sp. LPMIX5]